MKNKLVSVLVNNYNYAPYLIYCIDSVLNQTYKDYEILVYDDGSTDNSKEILSKYPDTVIKYYGTHEDNKPAFNQMKAINYLYKQSKGDIICLLDSDDAFKRTKIERVVELFNSRPNLCLVQHPFIEIDSASKYTGNKRPIYPLKKSDPKTEIYRTHNLSNLFVQTSGLSFSRDYLDKVMPLDTTMFDKVWADVRLSRQAIFYGESITINEPLGEYRVHGKNDSKKLKDKSYYSDLLNQLYEFFNSKAKDNNFPEIKLEYSVLRNDLPKIKK